MSLALFKIEERLLMFLKRKYGRFCSFFFKFRHEEKEPNCFLNGHNKNNLLPWLIRFCFPVMCDIIIKCSVLQPVSWREGNEVAEI